MGKHKTHSKHNTVASTSIISTNSLKCDCDRIILAGTWNNLTNSSTNEFYIYEKKNIVYFSGSSTLITGTTQEDVVDHTQAKQIMFSALLPECFRPNFDRLLPIVVMYQNHISAASLTIKTTGQIYLNGPDLINGFYLFQKNEPITTDIAVFWTIKDCDCDLKTTIKK